MAVHPLVQEEIDNTVTTARQMSNLDDACRFIQEQFSIKTGDCAAMFFSGITPEMWEELTENERALRPVDKVGHI